MSEQLGQELDIDTGAEKWRGRELAVNSDIPLMDDGTGRPYIIRQFEFAFDPSKVREIRRKKIPAPTKQELFNSVWKQIRTTLWGDGLVAIEDDKTPPRIVVGKKKFKVILLCEPKFGTMLVERPNTLQQITKPKQPSA